MASGNPSEIIALQYKRIEELQQQHAEELSTLQAQHEKTVADLEASWSQRYTQLKEELTSKLDHAATQLNQYRSAFEGDAGSWTTSRDPVTDAEIYVNLDTGETSEDKPEVMAIAELMQKVQAAEACNDELARTKKKCQQLEAAAKETQVLVTNCRLEIGSLKQAKAEWQNAGAAIGQIVDGTERAMTVLTTKIAEKLGKLISSITRVATGTEKMQRANRKLAVLIPRLKDAERSNKELQAKCNAFEAHYNSTTATLAQLRQDVDKEVELRCIPLRDALAKAQATLVAERVKVAFERSELAELWPPGWLLPTVLQPYQPVTAEEYTRRLALAQERDAERALREEIRANVAERVMWTKQLDPYGRTYYSHRETGEASWEAPSAMYYEPPPDRDELGNPVVHTTRSHGGEELDSNWTAVNRDDGKLVFIHKHTGEQRTTPPDTRQSLPKGTDASARVVSAAKVVIEYMSLCQQLKERQRLSATPSAADGSSRALNKSQPDTASGIVHFATVSNDSTSEEFSYDISTVEEIAAGSLPVQPSTTMSPESNNTEVVAAPQDTTPGSPHIPRHKQAEHLRTVLRRLGNEEEHATKKLDEIRDAIKATSKRLVKVTGTGVAPSWRSSALENPNLQNKSQRTKAFAFVISEYFVLCGFKSLSPTVADGIRFSQMLSVEEEVTRWLLDQLFNNALVPASSSLGADVVSADTISVDSANRHRYNRPATRIPHDEAPLVATHPNSTRGRDDENPTELATSTEVLLVQYPKPSRLFLYKEMVAKRQELPDAEPLNLQMQQRSDLMKLLLREDPEQLEMESSSTQTIDNKLVLEQVNPSVLLREMSIAHDQQLKELHQRISAVAKEIKASHSKYHDSLANWKEQVDQRLNVLRTASKSQRDDIAMQLSLLHKYPKPNFSDPDYDPHQNSALLEGIKQLRASYIVNNQTNNRASFYSELQATLQLGLKEFETALQSHVSACERFTVFRAMSASEHERHTQAVNRISCAIHELINQRAALLDARSFASNSLEAKTFAANADHTIATINNQIATTQTQLVDEGVRKRFTYEDELSAATAELARHQLVMARYRLLEQIVEGVNADFSQVEQLDAQAAKLMLAEAEADNSFTDVTGDYGEQYSSSKTWQSSELSRILERAAGLEQSWRQFLKTFAQQLDMSQRLGDALAARWDRVVVDPAEMWVPRAEASRAKEEFEAQTQQLAVLERKLHQQRAEIETAADKAERHLNVALEDHRNSQAAILKQNEVLRQQLQVLATWFRGSLQTAEEQQKAQMASARADVTQAYKEAQELREQFKQQIAAHTAALDRKNGLVTMLAIQLEEARSKADMEREIRTTQISQARDTIMSLRTQFRAERSYAARTALLVRMLRAVVQAKDAEIAKYKTELRKNKALRYDLKALAKDVREYKTVIARLFTDPDRLFQFFVRRIAALAGCGKFYNDALRMNGAADICVALLKHSGCATRRLAARALAEMTWDGCVEERFVTWEARAHWRRIANDILSEQAVAAEQQIVPTESASTDDAQFIPPPDLNLRTYIKQQRQLAIHHKRKREGLNQENCKLVNKGSGAIDAFIDLCLEQGEGDWRIAASAALALSTSSSDESNRNQLAGDARCMEFLAVLLGHSDPEVQMHSAVAVANIAYNNENAQVFFGEKGAVELLLQLCSSTITDVLEATSAALANLVCFNDANCKRVVESGGVSVLLDLVHSEVTESPLDAEQASEIHANVVETMANVCRYCPTDVEVHFSDPILGDIILLCASENVQIQRHVPLMIGNLAQHERLRTALGNLGAVEALLVLIDLDDLAIQSNVLWALCNLLWDSANQQRVGRYLDKVCSKLDSSWHPVKTHCLLTITNAAYFNDANRAAITELDGCLARIVGFLEQQDWEDAVLEASARALVVLSYELTSAWESEERRAVSAAIARLQEARVSEETKMLILELLINLCANHENQTHLFKSGGVATLVELQAHKNETIVALAHELLQFIGKPPTQEDLLRAKKQPDVEAIATLVENDDALVRIAAMQSLDEQLYDPVATVSDHVKALAVCFKVIANLEEPAEILLPALWGARNLIKSHPELKDNLRRHNGIEALVGVLRRIVHGNMNAQSASKVLNITLACLAVAVMAHRENSKALLADGVQILLDIAERKQIKSVEDALQRELQADNVVAVTSAILRSVGWFSQAKCPNCQSEQSVATHCFSCGHRLFKHAVR